jgi:hypothetical protein
VKTYKLGLGLKLLGMKCWQCKRLEDVAKGDDVGKIHW